MFILLAGACLFFIVDRIIFFAAHLRSFSYIDVEVKPISLKEFNQDSFAWIESDVHVYVKVKDQTATEKAKVRLYVSDVENTFTEILNKLDIKGYKLAPPELVLGVGSEILDEEKIHTVIGGPCLRFEDDDEHLTKLVMQAWDDGPVNEDNYKTLVVSYSKGIKRIDFVPISYKTIRPGVYFATVPA